MSRTLSEAASKGLLAGYGLAVLDEREVTSPTAASAAATEIGFPCVVKLCGNQIAHKTERNLVRLGLGSSAEVESAAAELLDAARPDDGPVTLLVAPMVRSSRELIVGALRSPDFGPAVMLGFGGVLAEAVDDAVFRLLPLDPYGAETMLDDLQHAALLDEFRGEPPVDRAALLEVVDVVGRALLDRPDIVSIDLNPVLIADGAPVAVDALVEVR